MGFIPSFLVPASKHRINHSSSHEWSKGKMRKEAKNIILEQWFPQNAVLLSSSIISTFGPGVPNWAWTAYRPLLEMQILMLHSRPTESEVIGGGPSVCGLTSPTVIRCMVGCVRAKAVAEISPYRNAEPGNRGFSAFYQN